MTERMTDHYAHHRAFVLAAAVSLATVPIVTASYLGGPLGFSVAGLCLMAAARKAQRAGRAIHIQLAGDEDPGMTTREVEDMSPGRAQRRGGVVAGVMMALGAALILLDAFLLVGGPA